MNEWDISSRHTFTFSEITGYIRITAQRRCAETKTETSINWLSILFGWIAVVETCDMNAIATDMNLIERLNAAASRGVSVGERRQQRISFVYANMPKGSDMTKSQVEQALNRLDNAEGRG